MQISNSAYTGVEVLLRLAVQNTDRPCTTQALARSINRSLSYTEALMARLRSAGLVVSRRGPGGGYVLAKSARRITVAEIFQAVDAPSSFVSRSWTKSTPTTERIHDLQGTDLPWEGLESHVLSFLNDVSLADLALRPAKVIGNDSDDRAEMRSAARH